MADYNVELAINQLREARDTREDSFRDMAATMASAAAVATAQLWPTDPAAAEQAGIGAVIAAATVAGIAQPGETTIVNCIGLFGLALVEEARKADLTRRVDGHPDA
jgi:hypothetical protein